MTKKTRLLFLLSFFLCAGINSCKRKGCTNISAENYDSKASKDDGSCVYAPPNRNLTGAYPCSDTITVHGKLLLVSAFTASVGENSTDTATLRLSGLPQSPGVHYLSLDGGTFNFNIKPAYFTYAANVVGKFISPNGLYMKYYNLDTTHSIYGLK